MPPQYNHRTDARSATNLVRLERFILHLRWMMGQLIPVSSTLHHHSSSGTFFGLMLPAPDNALASATTVRVSVKKTYSRKFAEINSSVILRVT